LSGAQTAALVAGLETLVTEFGNIGDPSRFDPHEHRSAYLLIRSIVIVSSQANRQT
jgi:hypothetical protein